MFDTQSPPKHTHAQICLLLSGALFYVFSFTDYLLRDFEGNIIQWFSSVGLPNPEGTYTVIKEINNSLLGGLKHHLFSLIVL